MGHDYIPSADGEFTPWVANFLTYVSAHLIELGLEATDVDFIVQEQTNWDFAYGQHTTAQANARSKREQKVEQRDILTASLRALVARLQASPLVDDTKRQAMGITVRAPRQTTASTPATHPLGWVDTSERLRHSVGFRNNSGTMGNAKPDGVIGCEVWVKIDGPPPVDGTEVSFVGMATRSPFTVVHDGADGGKKAHYMLRWMGSRGEAGPWSETVSATIAA